MVCPRLPAMPDCEETQTIRASGLQHAVGVQQRLGDVQLRLQVHRHDRVPAGGVHVDQQLVAGDAGVVDDDVHPAVPLAQVLDQPLRRRRRAVMSSCSAVPPISLATAASAVAGGRDVDGDDVRAVPGHDVGDRRADAAGGTGDDGDLAGQRLLVVLAGGHVGGRQGDAPGRRRRPTGRTGRTAPGRRSSPRRPRARRSGSPSSRRAAPCRSSGPVRPAPAGRRPAPGSRRRPAGRPGSAPGRWRAAA